MPEPSDDGIGASTPDNSAVGNPDTFSVATEHDASRDHNPTERESDVEGITNGSVVLSPSQGPDER